VSATPRFFPDGQLRADAFLAAETDARAEIEAISREFGHEHWREAYASSGTALALAEILEENGLSSGGITLQGLQRLRKRMVGAGHIRRLKLPGLKPERVPVLAGGLAIMSAALALLEVPRINPVGGAMRLGVLYDLLGRTAHKDIRAATVDRFIERYHVDRAHATRVAALAKSLYLKSSAKPRADSAQILSGRRCSTGRLYRLASDTAASATSWRTPTSRLLRAEQHRLALLVLGCRGGLAKWRRCSPREHARSCSRCASPCCSITRGPMRNRTSLAVDRTIRFGVSARWRKGARCRRICSITARRWRALGYPWKAAR
jgi:exopolyphosphatase/guanosine-5'-triphosphate,3'-diphosphate pyrophosphatase